ncbi:uncharacterized protein M6B38_271365 [Iris pallida]|uniref:Tic22-like family protein n=1 Tax=Iris pallida TaxID=29817 RepID=A0AAX6I857_IRIPA|nr:uncharacterized protein M6B38_271365 [Iris pallida]
MSSPEKIPPPLPSLFHSAGRHMQSLTANILSHIPLPPPPPPHRHRTPNSSASLDVPFLLSLKDGSSSSAAAAPIGSLSSSAPPSVRIQGLSSASKAVGGAGGGPAFVGQVFSMLDPSGNGLMAVTTHFDIPFLSNRTPEWIKKVFSTVTRSEKKSPVFHFFMDLSDAVSHVKKLNIPTGMVGSCRLDVAYEHFKEKPHMFKFIPNEKQVKAANRLLKEIPPKGGRRRRVNGVPVFTAKNLNIAIATNDGIKWYTPYFFDKNLLDNILEASVDQHFRTLIQNRHVQRRRDIIDDNLTAEVFEENGDNLFEPPEVQEVMDELGHPGIPPSVISKAAEIQLFDVVDKVLLGNKWLRKATGIQPRFPYLVDSFEERSAASFSKAATLTSIPTESEVGNSGESELQLNASGLDMDMRARGGQGQPSSHSDFQFPLGGWFSNPWSKSNGKPNTRTIGTDADDTCHVPLNPLLPKITMVGVSSGEAGQMTRASLKKTMEDLTKELEQASQKSTKCNEDKDPLFVANVGDYSSITRMNS